MADPTLLEAIDQVSREKGLNRQVLVETMKRPFSRQRKLPLESIANSKLA